MPVELPSTNCNITRQSGVRALQTVASCRYNYIARKLVPQSAIRKCSILTQELCAASRLCTALHSESMALRCRTMPLVGQAECRMATALQQAYGALALPTMVACAPCGIVEARRESCARDCGCCWRLGAQDSRCWSIQPSTPVQGLQQCQATWCGRLASRRVAPSRESLTPASCSSTMLLCCETVWRHQAAS